MMKSNKHVEQTLVIFKPDAVQRGVVGEILARFERVGLKIVGMKMLSPDQSHYYEHYETIGQVKTRRGENTFNQVVDFMLQSPVIAVVLEGIESVELVRKMIGSTEPKSAAVGTIRGDYSHISYGYADAAQKCVPNLIHASASVEEAEKEVGHWFSDSELYDYKTPNEVFTR